MNTNKRYRVFSPNSYASIFEGTLNEISNGLSDANGGEANARGFFHACEILDIDGKRLDGIYVGLMLDGSGVTRVINRLGFEDLDADLNTATGPDSYLIVANVAYFLAPSKTFGRDELWLANVYDTGVEWETAIAAKMCFEWLGTNFEGNWPTVDMIDEYTNKLRDIGMTPVRKTN